MTLDSPRTSLVTPALSWRDVRDPAGRRIGSVTVGPDGTTVAVCACLTRIPGGMTGDTVQALLAHQGTSGHNPRGVFSPRFRAVLR